MKKRILTTSTVFATLVGISQIASADGGGNIFIPMEKLSPEIRQQISESLLNLTNDLDIDWDSIVVGLNEDGDICLRSKNDYSDYQVISGFSCYTPKIENPDK